MDYDYKELLTSDMVTYTVPRADIVLQLTHGEYVKVLDGQLPLSALDLVEVGTVTRTYRVYRSKKMSVLARAIEKMAPRLVDQPD